MRHNAVETGRRLESPGLAELRACLGAALATLVQYLFSHALQFCTHADFESYATDALVALSC